MERTCRIMGKRRTACQISLRKFGKKRLFGKPMFVLCDHIKINDLEGVCVNMRRIN
jgi:hypothetical protein